MYRSGRDHGFGPLGLRGVPAILAALLLAGAAHAQTNPAAQALPYTQDFRALAASSTTYPAGWQGWINGAPGAAYLTTGPTGDAALIASSGASNATGGFHNYNGKIGPLDNGTNDFGLALAVNTTGFSGVRVAYEVMTIRNPHDGGSNTRINEISLQYRVGIAGAWTTVAGTAYQNNTTTQTGSGVVTPQKLEYRSIVLPAACNNQAVVQLRWAQLQVGGVGGRPSFAIDNVAVQQSPAGGMATALQFDGVNDYVTFGQAPALNASNFTIETWFRRTGTGVATTTDAGGIPSIVPLMAKGFSEAEASTADMNYILGINTAGNVIAADYEEGAGQASPGLNHPLSGTTAILNNVWYHAAATFDGTTLRIYLNGALEGSLVVGAGRLPQSSSIQHATLATALNSTGGIGTQTLGLFQGQLDEARIWNVARTACDISNNVGVELTSGTGLVARWGMSDGAGSVLTNSLATPNGILMNGPTWVAGPTYSGPPVPAAPTLLTANATDPTHVQLAWTDNATNESGYEVERSTTGPSGTFTLLATLAANANGFIDTPVSPSTEYCYRVRATSVCAGPSAYTSVACATTPVPVLATVNAVSPGATVTTVNPTVTVPVKIARTDATPILGFSIDFALSAELTTSTGSIAIGPFLTSVNPNVSFQVVDHGGGHYTADGVTLGPPCGATALDEVLFTIPVGSGSASGTGTVTIEAAHLRDCANDSVITAAGTSASVSIERTLPVVTVTAPNGGEFWIAGSAHDVTWTASDPSGIAASGVDLEYSTDGSIWTPIVSGIANASPYSWTTPNIVSATVQVRVTARDTYGNAGVDVSNAVFTIAGTTTTSLAVTPDPGIYLDPLTLTATVAPAAATGTVEFFEGLTSLGTAPLGTGTAELPVSTLSVGSHVLHATYLGSSLYAGSTSATVTREVKAKIVASAGANGSIAPPGTVLVSLNATPSFTLTPDPGYHVSAVTVDGSPAPLTSPYTFAPVSSNHTISVDFEVNPAVAPIATLTAAQVTTGNDADGTIKLKLHWTDVLPPGSTVEVYRARFGHYPEYDDDGGVAPVSPVYPPISPWAATAVTASDQTDEVNNVVGYDGRDVYTYVAFVRDQYGTYSPASNLTVGRPNYLLGDVSDGTIPGLGRGNNVVNGADISALGDSYGASGGAVAAVAYLDVGPTQDFSVTTRPLTDNSIDFEDLVVFAINFDVGAIPQYVSASRSARVASSRGTAVAAASSRVDRLTVEAPARVTAGEEFTVSLHLEGSGRAQALSAALLWKPGVVEPIGVDAGEWLSQVGGVALSPRPGVVDLALLGVRGGGFEGSGVVAVVRFRALASGEPGVVIGALRARDPSNQEVEITTSMVSREVPRPTLTELSAVYPNPFQGSAAIAFSIAEPGPVNVSVFGVDGRAVRTLASGTREPGQFRIAWDGRDDSGHGVPAGLYFVQLTTAHGRSTRSIAYLK